MKNLKRISSAIAMLICTVSFGQESNNNTTENKPIPDSSIASKSVKKGPIYIVDDKEVNQEYADKINPRDIKSVRVLTEKKAQLIYGPKGKEGAIVFTTNLANQK